MEVTAYSRFSPRPNSQECESCERQAEDIRKWCERKGWPVVAEFADKECSGDSGDRDQLFLAIKSAARRGHALVVRNLDRLARDIIMQELIIGRVRKKGGAVISLAGEGAVEGDDETGQDAMIRQIFGAINEQRRKLICFLTHRGMQRNMREGKLQTRRDGTIYGTRYDAATGKVVTNEGEREVIKMILDWQGHGNGECHIATLLNRAGIKPRRGARWWKSAVRKIIQREIFYRNGWKQRRRNAIILPD